MMIEMFYHSFEETGCNERDAASGNGSCPESDPSELDFQRNIVPVSSCPSF